MRAVRVRKLKREAKAAYPELLKRRPGFPFKCFFKNVKRNYNLGIK